MAKKKKNNRQGLPTSSEAPEDLDFMEGAEDAADEGEGESDSADAHGGGDSAANTATPPPSAPANSYREHMGSWESKAEKGAKASDNAKAQPGWDEIPAKYRKFNQ